MKTLKPAATQSMQIQYTFRININLTLSTFQLIFMSNKRTF